MYTPVLVQCRASAFASSVSAQQGSGGVTGHTLTQVDLGTYWNMEVVTAPRA